MTRRLKLSSINPFGRVRKPPPAEASLKAAAGWLARAQEATPDDGVSAFYDAAKKRWAGSYPETTGYIIPTLYDYAVLSGESGYAERATRMAAWECDIQLPEGGVMAGTMDADTRVPTIFNTGQVLFGWVRALRETGEQRYRDSLVRACDWLLSAQDEDGAWRRHGSPFTSHSVNTYNTRVAYGLAQAGAILNEPRYLDAASDNVEWALTQVRDNGWLENNDLEDNSKPLTHTIAYAVRGILEVGLLTGDTRFVERAEYIARAVAGTQRSDGALPGRLDPNWRPGARWSCLTGNAQMCIVWLRLSEAVSPRRWRHHSRRALDFTRATQSLRISNSGILGGIAGSAPVSGGYMRKRYPNWAAKFYMDALMLMDKAV
ncbi:MAG TPA: beta-L-arabinofuranosidase domain-containing protein [Gammaproteobacteria bacterium]|nr:beta-L-arabinofuranosidase domain-containing protein [Gammaproteobacteria bacterium]